VSATPATLAGAASGLVLVQASVSAGVPPFAALMGLGVDGTWGLWFAGVVVGGRGDDRLRLVPAGGWVAGLHLC
jgi:hypothetical protein